MRPRMPWNRDAVGSKAGQRLRKEEDLSVWSEKKCCGVGTLAVRDGLSVWCLLVKEEEVAGLY